MAGAFYLKTLSARLPIGQTLKAILFLQCIEDLCGFYWLSAVAAYAMARTSIFKAPSLQVPQTLH